MISHNRISSRAWLPVVASLAVLACGSSGSEDAATSQSEALAGSPEAITIGFNGGADQFAYFDEFRNASSASQHQLRLCHAYPSWDVALQKPGQGSTSLPGSRAWLEDWLKQAEGHCDEALLSFKASPKSQGGTGNEDSATTNPPSVNDFTTAFAAFRATEWVGWSGAFSFTPWNEPNNGAGSGNGLGRALTPDEAAAYYLAMRHLCSPPGCKVAAGDLASNGGMVADFQWNCSDDNVAPRDLCAGASYLDRYKNYIANSADDAPYHLGQGFRPEYFAFHPWHDVNSYVDSKEHCTTEAHCATRALLKNLGGSWGGVKLWDTEIGVGHDGNPALDDEVQACGAAFLMRLSANVTNRITRVYYTRLHNGNPELIAGSTPRPAMKVLADRERTYTAAACF
jgi:hypothetical protein